MSDRTRSAPPEPDDTRDPHTPTIGYPDAVTEAETPLAPAGYELLEEIGSGGMGVIYRARDIALNRHVAVKILHTRYLANGVAARRFVDEAGITGQLQHPGIPPVHQIGTLADGRPFLAMKLIKGSTFEDHLQERANPAEDRGRFLAVFEQVCQAVGYAHARTVIHRDLKPANVMVGAFAEVQVMDWGLAKTLTADRTVDAPAVEAEETVGTEILSLRDLDSATQAGSILGTPAFMPPEQAGGEIAKIDTRSDVFGLGAILCVILTGKPPYAGKDSETTRLMAIRGQLSEALTRLDACGAEPDLIALCKRCLSLEATDRPADAGEVAVAVAAFRAEAEERAKRAEIERARAEVLAAEQRKRRKVQAALGLSFTGLLVLSGAFAWWVQDQRMARENEARERRYTAQSEVNQAVEDAVAKFGRANGAGRDPVLWAEARAAALQAQVRATEVDAPSEVHERIRRLLADIERLEKNRRLVATLLEIQASMGDTMPKGTDQDFAAADERYAQAFRDYGTDLFQLSPEAGAELLKNLGGEVRVELAAAIDDWGYVRFARAYLARPDNTRPMNADTLVDTVRLFRVTRLLDPDPMRNRIRDIVVARDHTALSRLADETDVANQPVQTVNLIGVYLYWSRGSSGYAAPIRFLQRAYPHHPGDFQINFNLAFWLLQDGRFNESLPFCTAAIAVRPRSALGWKNYAVALSGAGRTHEAVAAWQWTCTLAPKNALARVYLAYYLSMDGEPGRAIAAYEEVLRTDPKAASAHLSLSWLLATGPAGVRDGKRAIEHATNACELTAWKEPTYIEGLAAAYAEVGQFDKAVDYQKRALVLGILLKSPSVGTRARLTFFERKQPYRDPRFERHDLAPQPREAKGQ